MGLLGILGTTSKLIPKGEQWHCSKSLEPHLTFSTSIMPNGEKATEIISACLHICIKFFLKLWYLKESTFPGSHEFQGTAIPESSWITDPHPKSKVNIQWGSPLWLSIRTAGTPLLPRSIDSEVRQASPSVSTLSSPGDSKVKRATQGNGRETKMPSY